MDFRVTRPRISVVAVCLLTFVALASFGCSGGGVSPSTAVKSDPKDDVRKSFYVLPTSLTYASPTASTQPFVASTQIDGDIGAVRSDVTVATVNPASAPAVKDPNDSRKSVTFTVTPVGSGTCTITATDKKGDTASVSVTIEAAPRLYVPNNFNNTVTEYDQNGNQITTSGTFPNVGKPNGITFDSANGHLYVANYSSNSITEYDQNGNQITPSGTFPNLDNPNGIAVDSSNGYLYVTDEFSHTVTVYDQNGNQITTSGTFPNAGAARGIAFDSSNGSLYVTGNNTVMEYDQNGNQIIPSGTFPNSGPVGIAFDSSNSNLYLTNGNTVTEFDQNGNQIITSGTFPNLNNALGIVFDSSNGYLYLTNVGTGGGGPYFITVYDQNGNQITTSGSFPNLDYPTYPTLVTTAP